MIRIETDGLIRKIGIDRPKKKNSLTAQMYSELASGFNAADSDESVRVIVFHGSEDCFTAGNDLQDFLADPPTGPDSPVYQFLRALAENRKPIIAAVAGHAVGIGTTALLHCDLIVASTNAQFRLPFTDLGLCPEAGSSVLLPATVGFKKAAELLLTGAPFSAADGLAMGLVNKVTDGSALTEALTIARVLAAKPPAAVMLTKKLLKQSTRDLVAATMENEAQEFVQRLQSPEAKEAFSAFVEKRPPDFSRL